MCLSWHHVKASHRQPHFIHHILQWQESQPLALTHFISHILTSNLSALWPCDSSDCLWSPSFSPSALLIPLLQPWPSAFAWPPFTFAVSSAIISTIWGLACSVMRGAPLGSSSPASSPGPNVLTHRFQPLHFSRNQGLLINPGWNLLWNNPESWNKPKGLLNSQQGKMPFNWLGWLHRKNLSGCYAKLETNLLDCLRNLPAHPDQNLLSRGVGPTQKQDYALKRLLLEQTQSGCASLGKEGEADIWGWVCMSCSVCLYVSFSEVLLTLEEDSA